MTPNVIVWTVFEVINHCESIGITIEVLTFVVGLVRSHLMMTTKKFTKIHIFPNRIK